MDIILKKIIATTCILFFTVVYSQSYEEELQIEIYTSIFSKNIENAENNIRKLISSEDESRQIIGHAYKAYLYSTKGELDDQLKSLEAAKRINNKISSKYGKAIIDVGYALYFFNTNDNSNFVEHNNRAIEFFSKEKPSINLFIAYFLKNSYNRSISSKTQYQSIQGISDLKNIASRLDSDLLKSLALNFEGVYNIDNKNIDKAIECYKNSYEIAKKIINKNIQNKLLFFYNINMSTVYIDKKNYQKALKFANESYTLSSKEKNLQDLVFGSLNNIGYIYASTNQQDKALTYYKLALEHLNKQNKSLNTDANEKNKITILSNLSQSYETLGNTKEAFNAQKQLFDTYYNYSEKRYDDNTRRLEILFQSKLKDDQLKSLKKQSNYIYAISALIIISLLSMIYIFSNRSTLRKKENQLLQIEREQAELSLKLEQEVKERLILEQEKVKKEALAATVRLQQKSNVIDMLKTNKQVLDDSELSRIIKQEQLIDKEIEDLQDLLNKINSKFYSDLNEIAKVKLTRMDLKYASYIYLNLDNQQIANTLNVDLNTVRVTKYRLKQKLGLSKDVDLSVFLHNIHNNV